MVNQNDPRKKRRFASVNEEILDRSIRHGAWLELHASFVSRRQLEFLQREVWPDVVGRLVSRMGRIRRRGGEMDWRAKNWLELVRAINAQIRSGALLLRDNLAEDLTKLAFSESEWLRVMLSKTVPFDFDFLAPSPTLVRAVVSKNPLNGQLLKDMFEDVDRATRNRVLQQVRIGIVSGDTTEQIVRRVRGTAANGYRDGVWNATRNQVQTVARTATNAVANHAHRLVHNANRGVMSKVKWVLTLDSRTCVVCVGYEADSPYEVDRAPYPPVHARCRCATAPVLSGWEEFGLDPKNLPEGTRASMDGQVPASLTFPQWLKGQKLEVQERVLGKTKSRLWREGKVDIRGMSDANGRIMSLDELRRREGLTDRDVRVRT